ncbi:OsmC-like protein [bacterium BMS3Abin07]|nr:OsmC-like protein [bacterium BMS3Abin07]GBE31605.1 OsmC-like protein [bacterium BMS3Bbin05]HDO21717.1 OsmC family peroxiredoxin [Nitrospirota bacterium]HDZ87072.1 OsmC family peroxiredoxin [Nitrospirota bacterium]
MTLINGLETDNLVKVVGQVKENWETGRTTWTASTTWKGGFKVETCSRDFTLTADEPEMLCGTNTAANPVEMVLQAYGACLSIGFAMNAAVRGIKLDDIKIELAGEIDLPGFLGLEPPENLNMDKLPGFKTITAKIKIKGDADANTLKELHEHVISTSPVGITLSRPVDIKTSLET